jgi:hypothetical protein
MNHFNQLRLAFDTEWQALGLPNQHIESDGSRFWWVRDNDGREIIQWECRNFPGCATLIITTKVELRADLRGRGLGKLYRQLRHRAYKRAGFQGEIATVRTDNAPQIRLMQDMGGVVMGEFPSDYGGTYKLWLTKLPELVTVQPVPRPAAPTLPMPPLTATARTNAERAEVAYQAFAAPQQALHAELDRIAFTPNIVDPLPGDTFGFFRHETDDALRARINARLTPPVPPSPRATIVYSHQQKGAK